MIAAVRRAPRGLALLLLLLLLPGCAGRLPQTTPLVAGERERVRAGIAALSSRDCPLALDADISLEVQLLGKAQRSAGILQYEGPASLRYALVDPLGRSLFIMVTDGSTFTMVYNREAKAVTGSTTSRFWQDYVPRGVTAEDTLLLLAGGLPADLRVRDIRGDRAGAGIWLFATGAEGIRHEVLLNPEVSRVLRHILKDGRDTVLFDVAYDQYEEAAPACARPVSLHVEGKTITGTLALRIDKIYPNPSFPPQTFHITPPPHFEVQQVE